ncbi:hypothetical protein LR69_01253 [Geobacillus sp. BCO2]|nr:hypothetical protein LR69_01253 [Geobacillus sp. BCO2]
MERIPVILALIPTNKNNIVRALVVQSETGEILYRKEFVTVDLYDETVLDRIATYIERNFPVYITQLSLPKKGELE